MLHPNVSSTLCDTFNKIMQRLKSFFKRVHMISSTVVLHGWVCLPPYHQAKHWLHKSRFHSRFHIYSFLVNAMADFIWMQIEPCGWDANVSCVLLCERSSRLVPSGALPRSVGVHMEQPRPPSLQAPCTAVTNVGDETSQDNSTLTGWCIHVGLSLISIIVRALSQKDLDVAHHCDGSLRTWMRHITVIQPVSTEGLDEAHHCDTTSTKGVDEAHYCDTTKQHWGLGCGSSLWYNQH